MELCVGVCFSPPIFGTWDEKIRIVHLTLELGTELSLDLYLQPHTTYEVVFWFLYFFLGKKLL